VVGEVLQDRGLDSVFVDPLGGGGVAPAGAIGPRLCGGPVPGRGADRLPETITYDGKEVEVTHNAADGLWVEGLPGEPPARIGDLVSSADDPARGRGEKLRNEFNKEAEDIAEQGGKWADFVQEILDNPRPTHSMTLSRSPEVAMAGPEHGINAGQGAEALLTLAIVGAAAARKLHERWQRHGSMAGRREAHDAGN
jgi:hypothetical protein